MAPQECEKLVNFIVSLPQNSSNHKDRFKNEKNELFNHSFCTFSTAESRKSLQNVETFLIFEQW
jgi:hypothetical protein